MDLGRTGLAKGLHDLLVVVPRTIESSTTTRRLPRIESGSGLSFSFTPRSRSDCDGWMNVRPT